MSNCARCGAHLDVPGGKLGDEEFCHAGDKKLLTCFMLTRYDRTFPPGDEFYAKVLAMVTAHGNGLNDIEADGVAE